VEKSIDYRYNIPKSMRDLPEWLKPFIVHEKMCWLIVLLVKCRLKSRCAATTCGISRCRAAGAWVADNRDLRPGVRFFFWKEVRSALFPGRNFISQIRHVLRLIDD
jgi:hypothetical protein